jgi:rhamnosyltransferase subunit B
MEKQAVSDILLCTLGSAGDVFPFIGVGLGLSQRGYRVTLITSQFFETAAGDAGLEFLGLGSREDYQSIIENPDLWDPRSGFRVFAESVVLPTMEPVYEIISRFDPSTAIVVAQGQAFGAHIAHEKLGFPFITVHLQPAAFRSVHDFPLLPAWMPPLFKRGIFRLVDALVLDKVFAPGINRLRRKLGLPAVSRIFDRWMHSPQKNLGLFPDWFALPQPDWPPQTQLTGFVFYDRPDKPETDAERLEQFLNAGSAPIVCTAGTAMRHANQFFADCAQACLMLGRRGILLTQHPDQLPRDLTQEIQHASYLPFSQILPRALALVHHGGIGTTAQAIAAGIPQVVRPMAHDQPDNAARVVRLGIGASLTPNRFNAASLAEKLNALISSPQVLGRCKSYARKIDPAQSLDAACTIIEDFARQHS